MRRSLGVGHAGFDVSRRLNQMQMLTNTTGNAGYRVHLVTGDVRLVEQVHGLLTFSGLDIHIYPSAEAFLRTVQKYLSGCLICSLDLPGCDGVELLERLRKRRQSIPTIILARHCDVPLAVRAVQAGAIELLDSENVDVRLPQAVRLMLRKHG